ncbi:MAG: hypothetical protein J6U12_05080 [Candidatus Methanomethylophilaceae archaeon]|nr:hypothetical protein [Candidatus Methanomethylophilaceae archaeon]MBO7352268.1 hypothetical protein [Candidatus Methanomethylophilaceae archaeon]MBP5684946.1 hypothetical protein [Candidatus Methanomethylophilaceae archaeon]MBP5735427.1 hypothetical protein [Candidatus Methanomethylophilaceae archaeon]
MNGYFSAMQGKGFSYESTGSVRKMDCPNCGFSFSLVYARAVACRGCSKAYYGCSKVRCARCDSEFPLTISKDVANPYQERVMSNHIAGVIRNDMDSKGITVLNR